MSLRLSLGSEHHLYSLILAILKLLACVVTRDADGGDNEDHEEIGDADDDDDNYNYVDDDDDDDDNDE